LKNRNKDNDNRLNAMPPTRMMDKQSYRQNRSILHHRTNNTTSFFTFARTCDNATEGYYQVAGQTKLWYRDNIL